MEKENISANLAKFNIIVSSFHFDITVIAFARITRKIPASSTKHDAASWFLWMEKNVYVLTKRMCSDSLANIQRKVEIKLERFRREREVFL